MTQVFRVLIKDELHHRIVIDKDVWDALGLEKGDLIEVAIKKLRVIEE